MSLKLSKNLFFFSIIFAPLAFGTTETWSYAVMEICVSLSLLSFFIYIFKHNKELYHVPGLIPLLLFLLYILFQLVPLPLSVIEFLSPQASEIYQGNNFLAGVNSWACLSLNPKATLSEFMRYSTYVLFFILTVQLLKNRGVFQSTIFIIALFGGLLAFSSILQFYMTQDMALWFRYTPDNSIVVGPYVNHNHYAGLMELIFPVVLGLFLFYRPRIQNTSLIKGIAEIFSQEKANIHILIGASALLIIISIFVSLSRGAMISTCLSLIVFTIFLLQRKISRGNTTLIIGVIMLSALCIGWFGWDQIIERFAKLKNAQGVIYEARLDFWKDSQEMIDSYKLTGSGIGTFPHVYPLHRSLKSELFLSHAHNDYLELLAEGGIIGFGLAAIFLLTLFYKTYKIFINRRDGFSIYIYIGSITAMTSILLHSFTDFNMHIGANGLWFFFIAGVAVSAANTGIRKGSRATRLEPVKSKFLKTGAAVLAFTLFTGIFVYNISNLLGQFYYSNIKNYTMSTETPSEIMKKLDNIAETASSFDPLHADYKYLNANTAWFLNDIEKSRNLFLNSLNLDPLNPRHLNRFANFLAMQKEPEKAGIAFKNSMLYDKSRAEYTFQYGTWLFARKKSDQALKYIKKALILDEKLIDRVLTAMIVNGITEDEMEKAVPDIPAASIAFAQFLYDTGKFEKAVDRYLDTLDMIENMQVKQSLSGRHQNQITRSYFLKIYWFFKKHNDLSNAMHVIKRAEAKLPGDASIKVVFADLYYQQGILYKALDKYDHALLLDPANKKALKMIKKINQ
ncbi:MAG: O-antigen ligase family protein [Thermodesulfobacteriota bacterium]